MGRFPAAQKTREIRERGRKYMRTKIQNKTASAEIESLGAQLMSLKNAEGTEYLWQGNPAFWSSRAPVLFPTVGNVRGGTTIINGKPYALKRHGFARNLEHSVLDSGANFITYSLKDSEETRKLYPFVFELRVTYRLVENGLTTEFAVFNRGDKELPFGIGGHPGFRCPLVPGERFEDYRILFEKEETADCPTIDIQTGLIDFHKRHTVLRGEREISLRHDLFVNDALVFDALESTKVKVVSRVSGRGVEMDFAGYPMLGIWSPLGEAPLVALEPWAGCATAKDEDDVFTHKRYLNVLEPGESKVFTFTVKLL